MPDEIIELQLLAIFMEDLSSILTMDNNVTLEEIRSFHTMDRRLYTVLVRELSQDATESLQVMGLWLWLERKGSLNLVHKILQLSNHSIETLFSEATECLKCMEGRFPAGGSTGIPFTRHISGVEEAGLHFFQENRLTAFRGVQRLVSEVCIPALSDILETARRDALQNSPPQNQVVLHPVHGAQGVRVDTSPETFLRMGIRGVPSQGPSNADPRCNRTMFVTFSKGYPVSDVELWSFIIGTQGQNCIESIYMQDVAPGEQAIYAKVVFSDASYIVSVLGGHENVRFSINGKHVRMRKYV